MKLLTSRLDTRKSTKAPPTRKRTVLLDEQYEKIIKQEEQEEFTRVIQDQYSNVDVNNITSLPEFQNDQSLNRDRDHSWEYWMSIMMQYQCARSFVHYTSDVTAQEKEKRWQKDMRFQLMQKKRAIKREKRRQLKMIIQWEKKKQQMVDQPYTTMVHDPDQYIQLDDLDCTSESSCDSSSGSDSFDDICDHGDVIEYLDNFWNAKELNI